MDPGRHFEGSLFAGDYLRGAIKETAVWQEIDDKSIKRLESDLRGILTRFPVDQSPNEAQTEDDLIWPILRRLGWAAFLRQQNLSTSGRVDVPDGLLFAHDAAKVRANLLSQEWQRYEHGVAVVEAKRWSRPLDRRSGQPGEASTPAMQLQRYLRRIDDLTSGGIRWGILTNGGQWRLYWAGARSVSEQFFDIDVAALLGDAQPEAEALSLAERHHWLRVFLLIFRPDAFLPADVDGRTFHQQIIEEGRYYQERVAQSLSQLVFDQVFPTLVSALAEEAPGESLGVVRDAALVFLYRLLFILYAEDRDLLPARDKKYDDYALREQVRGSIGRRKDSKDAFSREVAWYWAAIDNLCRVIDTGDASIGLPPYNGGLFDRSRTPLLTQVRLADAVMADIIDALSFENTASGRRYINYRDLGVQQLGSIYERLLEMEIVRDEGIVTVRPNSFARKDSGSYYTPNDLVDLIIREAVGPLADSLLDSFKNEALAPASSPDSEALRMNRLRRLDPAEKLLELNVCDPAMGSGHFLVNLVDFLADKVIEAMAETETLVEGYWSPLTERIDTIRSTITANAEDSGWTFDPARLDDRHIIRRMVLKRCVYGVDKNPMAVELAKVSLWLHTFTVGAPLSFLDHHLRCGDSLFGAWVRQATVLAEASSPAYLRDALLKATGSAKRMQIIEGFTDAEISEAHRTAEIFEEITEMTAPLNAFMSLIHAFSWLNLKDRSVKTARMSWLQGSEGDPIHVAMGNVPVEDASAEILGTALETADQERFLNWQVAFPGVWSDWDADDLTGGFDAVIGNPPWDRMKLQQVEWFAMRRPKIAKAQTASERKRRIAELYENGYPLAVEYESARKRAEASMRVARTSGDYPLLAQGDLNLYSLFVERALTLIKPDGLVGLLVPSGIASDKSASTFFKRVSTQGRLKALYDFENGRKGKDPPAFFLEVHRSFKFCAFVASRSSLKAPAHCGFFLQDVSEIEDAERCFQMSADEFARVNPNTGTAPIFRSRKDKELTTAIYERLPVLVDRSSGEVKKTWPVRYNRMFDMTNDAHLFRTRKQLEEDEGAWHIGGNRFDSPSGVWVPMYEGKMIQAFDHRAASVTINPATLHSVGQPEPATREQYRDRSWTPNPRYWVLQEETVGLQTSFVLGYRAITNTTNMRTCIAALLPAVGFGNSIPILVPGESVRAAWLLASNFNSLPFNFVTRQKVQGQNLNWYHMEQLPVVPPEQYEATVFGPKTAEDIVREAVLELTYTAHDMAPFARDMDYVDERGAVLPPFRWDEDRRLYLKAKLDALYFILYGVTKRDDVRYIYSTFPIVERQETAKHEAYRSRDLCLAWMNALAAGQPGADITI